MCPSLLNHCFHCEWRCYLRLPIVPSMCEYRGYQIVQRTGLFDNEKTLFCLLFVYPRRGHVVGSLGVVVGRLHCLSTCSYKLFNDGKGDTETEQDRVSLQLCSWRKVIHAIAAVPRHHPRGVERGFWTRPGSLKILTLYLEPKRFPEKCRQKGNGRNSSSQQENEGESRGEMPYVAHLSPEKRGSVGGVEVEEKEGWWKRISSTTRSLPPIHLEDISAQIQSRPIRSQCVSTLGGWGRGCHGAFIMFLII